MPPITHPFIKCLSIRQPWAWLVCVGAKNIENRTWSPRYRGVVAVRAGASSRGIELLRSKDTSGLIDVSRFSLGAIIGAVQLVLQR